MRKPLYAALTAVALLAACAEAPKTAANNRDTMTKRQKDSVLSATGIPGASNISKAQRAADSAAARNRSLDSIP